MTGDAVRSAMELSSAQGAAWHVLRALVERAQDCIACPSLEDLWSTTRYSTRNIIRALNSLEELEEIERLQSVVDRRRRAYHLKKICDIKNSTTREEGTFSCPHLAEFSMGSKIGDWSKKEEKEMSPIPPLLPEVIEAKLRIFRGQEPLWILAPTAQSERYFWEECRARAGIGLKPHGDEPPAEQLPLDWERGLANFQKARLEQWARENGVRVADDPELKREKALARNVIVFQRRTA